MLGRVRCRTDYSARWQRLGDDPGLQAETGDGIARALDGCLRDQDLPLTDCTLRACCDAGSSGTASSDATE